jgi:hypothetical protein
MTVDTLLTSLNSTEAFILADGEKKIEEEIDTRGFVTTLLVVLAHNLMQVLPTQ